MNYWHLLIPVISAAIGWVCTQAAFRILFQQIIPNRRHLLATQVSKAISAEFSFATIENKINDPANAKKIMPVVESHVDDFLRHKLKAKMPMIGMLIGDKTINSLKEVFLKEIEDMFPEVIKKFTGDLKNDLDIENMVANKINGISPGQLQKTLSPVLRYFELTAIITGFIIGLINLAFILLIS